MPIHHTRISHCFSLSLRPIAQLNSSPNSFTPDNHQTPEANSADDTPPT
jgi:hypothetical protein